MDEDVFPLEWKTYDFASRNAFSNLYDDEVFTDVTIACEDNHKIKAHKVVLSICSNYFRKILTENPHPHPLIFLQGINIDTLRLLKKFIYLGKANVEQNIIKNFLLTSQTLLNHTEPPEDNRIKQEISRNIDVEEMSINTDESIPNKMVPNIHILTKTQSVDKELDQENIMKQEILDGNHIKDMSIHSNGSMVNKVMDNLDMKFEKKLIIKNNYECSMCKFKSNFELKLAKHIQTHHDIPCNSCGLVFERRRALREHVVKEHDNLKCTVLECSFTSKSIHNFHRHTFLEHSVLKQCDKCEYTTRRLALLKGHMETHSSNLIYNCKKCDLKTNTKQKMIFHERKVHLEILYECKICSFKTAKSSNLSAHNLIHSKKKDDIKTKEKDKNYTQFQCEQCNKSWDSNQGLKIHNSLIHTINGAKPERKE